MPEEQYKNYDDLSIFLNAQMIAGILGVSLSSAYELFLEKGLPARWIGSRLAAPKNGPTTLTALHKNGKLYVTKLNLRLYYCYDIVIMSFYIIWFCVPNDR